MQNKEVYVIKWKTI